MMILAKEGGQVGGDGVRELLEFLRCTGAEQFDVVRKGHHAEAPQAAHQPAVDELPLRFAEGNSGVLADELADLVEFAVGQDKIPISPPRATVGWGSHGQKRSTWPGDPASRIFFSVFTTCSALAPPTSRSNITRSCSML